MPDQAFFFKIHSIPGRDGWIDRNNRRVFEKVAAAMVASGIEQSRIITMLEQMYWAVCDEYGKE